MNASSTGALSDGAASKTRPAAAPEELWVKLGERSYAIRIGSGLLADCGPCIRSVTAAHRVAVIADSHVAPLYLARVENSLRAAAFDVMGVTVAAGEGSKDFKTLERLCEDLLQWGIDRKCALVALGGGVVGDLVGFAAAILLRGLDFVQIPTTLLAQVDSSVGGKTAINAKTGKNLIGAFHQPRIVLADTDILDSLPPRELAAGYAEIVKYGLINRPDFFAWLERNGEALLAGDADARRKAIRTGCAIKADIVAQDEREGGVRALLNLGHTFGHALEAECGFSDRLLHGEAVAMGCAMAFGFSERIGLCSGEDAARAARHLAQVGLPSAATDVSPRAGAWDAERLLQHMGRDKKIEAGRLTFVLSHGIGRAFVQKDVDARAVKDYLREWIAAG